MKNSKLAVVAAIAGVALAAFNAHAQTRILPFGDSVTSSYAPYSSYRYWLWNELIDAGYNVDFVGTQFGVEGGSPEHMDFDQDHEGHPGWTSQDAVENVDRIAHATQPDIVLLDFGANDVEQGLPLETTMANLSQIVETFRQVNPDVVILMAQPTPSNGPNHRMFSKLKGKIHKVAKMEQKAGANVTTVNLFGGYNVRKDTFDGEHPNEKGEQKIAKRYFKKLKRIFRHR